MGGCMSQKASKSHDVSNSPREFYRQESILGGTHRNEDECPWKERIVNVEVNMSESLPLESKETVFQSLWNNGKDSSKKGDEPNTESLQLIAHEDQIVEHHYYSIDPAIPISNQVSNRKGPTCKLPSLPKLQAYETEDHARQQVADTCDEVISKKEYESRCFEYKEMVKIFKPLIVQNLIVHDILPSLPFLDNHDDIYAEAKNHSPKQAVVSLLNEMERSNELGKWDKFIDALRSNGYTYIVDNIMGYKLINHNYQKQYIKSLTPKIGKMIVPRELLPHLMTRELISHCDKENIQREAINNGDFAAAVVLLDRVHRKHRNWYILFIEALNEAKMEEVASNLSIIPELLENKRTKDIDHELYEANDERLLTQKLNSLSATYKDEVPECGTGAKFAETKNDNHECITPTYTVHDSVGAWPYSFDDYKPTIPKTTASEPLEDEYYEGIGNNFQESITDTEETVYGIPPAPRISMLMAIKPGLGFQSRKMTFDSVKDESNIYEEYDVNLDKKSKDETIPPPPILPRKYIVEKKGAIRNNSSIWDSETSDVDSTAGESILENDIDKLENDHDDIRSKRRLLEKKSTLLTKNIDGIRKQRAVLQDIALKEKELGALQTVSCVKEETNDDVINIVDAYYPTLNSPNHEPACRTVPVKHLFDYRELIPVDHSQPSVFPLLTKSQNSIVEIYTPHFSRRSTISELFENDSGISFDMGVYF